MKRTILFFVMALMAVGVVGAVDGDYGSGIYGDGLYGVGTVTPVAPPPSGGGGGGGGGGVASPVPIVVIPTRESVAISAPLNQKIQVIWGGVVTDYKLALFTSAKAVLKELPSMDSFEVVNGATRRFDYDGDGSDDVAVQYQGKRSGNAVLVWYEINKPSRPVVAPPGTYNRTSVPVVEYVEAVPEPELVVEPVISGEVRAEIVPPPVRNKFPWVAVLIGVVIVCLIVGIGMYVSSRKKDNE